MEISGHTQMLCLIGSPVGHSGSPAMYNYSFLIMLTFMFRSLLRNISVSSLSGEI